ncbi:MAG: DNA-directed RNA polymerase subunit K [Thermoprotei archaeon]
MEKNIKIGPPWLTKYERTRIIGARALQLSLGAPPLLPKEKLKGKNELEIAETELESGVLPMLIYRRKPNGQTQVLSLSELNKPV